MEVRTFRDDALAEQGPDGSLLVRGVLVSHFLSPNKIAPLHTMTEVEFKPGTVYKVFTGLSLVGISNPFQIGVRAVEKIFKNGVQVCRVDLGDRNEIIAYITTAVPFKFVKSEPMFEIFMLSQPAIPAMTQGVLEIKPEAVASTPGTFHKETVHLKETMPQAPMPLTAPNENTDAADAKKVSDWLNSPDQGKEIGTDEPGVRPYVGPAVVADTGPKAKTMNPKLARL